MNAVDPVLVSAAIATAGTILSGLGLAWLGRKWGLPGLGREVQQQQAVLISTLQAEVSELRTQQKLDEEKIGKLTQDLAAARQQIAEQRSELLQLYRLTGKTVPSAW